MIRIGLSQKEKQKTISDYIFTHMEIKKVYVLFYKKFKPSYKVDVDIEYMSCNGAAFEIDDIVVVQFDGNSWDTPKIIGFKDIKSPLKCTYIYIMYT